MQENKESQKSPEQKGVSAGISIGLQDVLMREAYEHIARGEHEAAANIFEDILRKFGKNIDDNQKNLIHSELAMVYFWLGSYDSAEYSAENALGFGENDQAYVVLGRIALARFNFPQARGFFSKISKENPARPLGLCLVSIKLRDIVGAEIFLREAKDMKRPDFEKELGVYEAYIFLLKGDSKNAVAIVRGFAPKCERDPFLHLIIAEIFMTAGNYGEATAAAEKIKKTCPQNDGVFAVLAHSAYAQEDYLNADSFAHEAVRLNPFNAYAKTVLMKLAVRSGSYDFAESIGSQILVDTPEYSLAHANLGDVYFIQGRYELAQIEYDQTQQLMNSDTKGARLRKARMKFMDKDYKGAAIILEQLIESHHTYYDDAMCDLALCYDKLGDEEKKSEVMDKMAFRRSFYHRTENLLKTL